MRATDLLKRQHKEVLSLFKKAEKSESENQRRALCEQIVADLEAHARIEEELFYPAIRGVGTKKAQALYFEALEEHHAVKLLLAELPEVDPRDERFVAKVTVLMEMVKHHIKEEEEEMFPIAEKLGDEELKDLGTEMETEFEQIRAEEPPIRLSSGSRAGRSAPDPQYARRRNGGRSRGSGMRAPGTGEGRSAQE